MTGIDQEMMQKNLSCKNLREAQKNVCSYSLLFIPVNFLFLCLGILLLNFASANGIALPESGDAILPMLVTANYFGTAVIVFFIIGIIAVTFASADSALTGLTTSVCVDILGVSKYKDTKAKKIRFFVHLGLSILFIAIMLLFKTINNTSVLNAIYTIASYAYGPLLGLFAFGILTKYAVKDKWVPLVCILAPVLCGIIDAHSVRWFNGYQFSYELLIMNAAFTFAGLFFAKKMPKKNI